MLFLQALMILYFTAQIDCFEAFNGDECNVHKIRKVSMVIHVYGSER